ncbi:hypothetical protein HHI36_008397, partial [Cryptolaemus montrouzieri]
MFIRAVQPKHHYKATLDKHKKKQKYSFAEIEIKIHYLAIVLLYQIIKQQKSLPAKTNS